MKNRIQRGTRKTLVMLLVVLFALSLLILTACNEVTVSKIEVVDGYETSLKIGEFNVADITLKVWDEGSEDPRTVGMTANMLSAESRELIKTAGTHTLTVYYQKKSTTFQITLYPDDAELVTVTFWGSDKNTAISSVRIIKGGTVKFPTVADVTGWADAEGNEVEEDAKIDENTDLHAIFKQTTKKYTVTFKDYLGNVVGTVQVDEGKKISAIPTYTQPAAVASYQWYYGSSVLDIDKQTITRSVDITMQVTFTQYPVTFRYLKDNGTYETLATENVIHGEAAKNASKAATTLSEKGYSFEKWDKSYDNVTQELVITAVATKKEYTVSFYDYDNKIIATRKVKHGEAVANVPTESTLKMGYDFDGWSVTNFTNITKNTDVTAKYLPKAVTVVLYNEKGTSFPMTMYFDSEIFVKNVVEGGSTLAKLYVKSSLDGSESLFGEAVVGKSFSGLYADEAKTQAYAIPYKIPLSGKSIPFYIDWLDPTKGTSGLSYLDIDADTCEVAGYTGVSTTVYIPAMNNGRKVVGIGNYAFSTKGGQQMNAKVDTVIFGENLTYIGNYAFAGAALTGDITIPEGIVKIGEYAFYETEGITSVSIPSTLTEIGEGAFCVIETLASVVFAEGIALAELAKDVFSSTGLTEIVLPSSIKTIAPFAFSECKLLASINLDNVTEVGEGAFSQCESLTNIGSTEKLAKIEETAFAYSGLTEISLPAITELGKKAFEGLEKLTKVTLGAQLVILKENTFALCPSLTQIVFETKTENDAVVGLAQIEKLAFASSYALAEITLPSTVSIIDADAFAYSGLKAIAVAEGDASFESVGGVLFAADGKKLVAYPPALSASLYVVPDGVTEIGVSAFSTAQVAAIELPLALETVGNLAFESTYIKSLIFNGGVVGDSTEGAVLTSVYIADEANLDAFKAVFGDIVFVIDGEVEISDIYDEATGLFYSVKNGAATITGANSSAKTLVIPEKIGGTTDEEGKVLKAGVAVTAIADSALSMYMFLESVTVNAALETLGSSAFAGSTNLAEIVFTKTIVDPIPLDAFADTAWYDNNYLIVVAGKAIKFKQEYDDNNNPVHTEIVIPAGVTELGYELFYRHGEINSISLPDSLVTIGEWALAYTSVTSLVFPKNVTDIGIRAFAFCLELVLADFSGSNVEYIPEMAFGACYNLKKVVLADFTTRIGKAAFSGCDVLAEINLPAALVSIGANAFDSCKALTSVSLYQNIGAGISDGGVAIGNRAFNNCSALVSVRVWGQTPYAIGANAFPNTAYIYVPNSANQSILNAYKNHTDWSSYSNNIKEYSATPIFSFEVSKLRTESGIETLESMSDVIINSVVTPVLSTAPAVTAPEGYILLGWTNDTATWALVKFPYAATSDTTLVAVWVPENGGSLYLDSSVNRNNEGYELTQYTGNSSKIIISSAYLDSVLYAIGDGAFAGCEAEEIIFTGTGLRYIGANAFANMPNLKRIVLPEGVIAIGADAFNGCSKLEYIYIPSSVTTVGAGAFDTTSLSEIEFAEGSKLYNADVSAFSGSGWYSRLSAANEQFIIAGSLLIAYNSAESVSVTMPLSVKAIASEVFKENTIIEVVTLHSGITYIGDSAFLNCSSLSLIEFGTDIYSLEYIGTDAFTGTKWLANQGRMVYVGNILKSYVCQSDADETVVLPDFITIIDDGAFAYQPVKSIVLPANLISIGENAFAECGSLEAVTIPKTVTSIGANAFANAIALKAVYFEEGSVLETIGDYAFKNCISLGSAADAVELVLPASVKNMGIGVFMNNTALRRVDLTNTQITSISDDMFNGATALVSVKLSEKVISFSARAFANATALATIEIPETAQFTSLGTDALLNTKWINRTPGEDEDYILIYIGALLLKYVVSTNPSAMPEISVPSHIKYIGAGAFYTAGSATYIASVTLPNGLLEIRAEAFKNCSYLASIVIPDSVTVVENSAFFGCSLLEEVTLGTGLEKIGESAFAECTGLRKIYIKRMAYGELTQEQIAEIGAILGVGGEFAAWFNANREVFSGTELMNTNSIPAATTNLRIYVADDNQNFNLEFYRVAWNVSNIYNENVLPTVTFNTGSSGASNIAPKSTELLKEEDINVFYSGHTLFGWKDSSGSYVTFPLKVYSDMTLDAVWVAHKRTGGANDNELGFTYSFDTTAKTASITNYAASSNAFAPTVVIPLSVVDQNSGAEYPITSIGNGVFYEGNSASITKVLFVRGSKIVIGEQNPFFRMTDLESFVTEGTAAAIEAVDGVLYTAGRGSLLAYPAKRTEDDAVAESYSIDSSAATLVSYAFSSTELKELTVPVSVKYILNYAFVSNTLLASVVFEAGSEIVSVGASYAGNAVTNGLGGTKWYTDMVAANEVFKKAGSYLLSYDGKGDNVVVPDGIFTIGNYAFSMNGNSVEKLTIPSSVGRINENAFYNCSNITDIVFNANSSLTEIANDVFNSTSWISSMGNDANEFVVAGSVLVKYRGSSSTVIVPSEATVIGYAAFDNKSFSNIEIHSGVIRIDANAFFNCQNLVSITLPASLKKISDRAFYGCSQLASVSFAGTGAITEIGAEAFYNCTRLAAIAFPDALEAIGDKAFEGTSSLRTATFNQSSKLKELGASAFKASGITRIFIPASVKEIKEYSFQDCSSLVTLEFSDGNRSLTKIGTSAFENCQQLGSSLSGRSDLLTVVLPNNVTTIEARAFFGCTNMYGIWLGESLLSIGEEAFLQCKKLANITISAAQPPLLSNSFSADNQEGFVRKRVYVNASSNSGDNSTLTQYRNQWGMHATAQDRIVLRGTKLKVRIVDVNGVEETLIAELDQYQFLSADKLSAVNISSHPIKGEAVGFHTNRLAPTQSTICTSGAPYFILEETTTTLYVTWANA